MKRKTSFFVALILCAALLTACTQGAGDVSSATTSSVQEESTQQPADTSSGTDDAADPSGAADSSDTLARVVYDSKGNEIEVPKQVDSIISLAPSTTQLLIDLGVADRIVATDTYSAADYADELPAGIPAFDMMNPDNEQIVALSSDLVFTTGMSYSWGEDVFASARDAGVTIIDIESAASLQEIMEQIVFIGECVKEKEAAEEIAQEMEAFLAEVKTLTEEADPAVRKRVLFELSTPTADFPTIYSVGPGSYIDEILTLIGAENVAHDTDSPWITLTEEAAIACNPDVILSTDNYTPDVEQVLLTLSGWENVSAVQNKEVYLIDADRINRPNHRVCGSILEIGLLLYPELFEQLTAPFVEEALPDAA